MWAKIKSFLKRFVPVSRRRYEADFNAFLERHDEKMSDILKLLAKSGLSADENNKEHL